MYHYSIDFTQEVDKLVDTKKEILPIETRIQQVEDLCEHYYAATGCRPPVYELDRLGSYLLADELRDKSTHKSKKSTFPVLSMTQIKLRNRRERRVGDDNLDFIKLKEVLTHPNAFKAKTQNKEDV